MTANACAVTGKFLASEVAKLKARQDELEGLVRALLEAAAESQPDWLQAGHRAFLARVRERDARRALRAGRGMA